MQARINVSVTICAEREFDAEEPVERLTTDVIPQFFDSRQLGEQIHKSEILSAVLRTPGVRSAKIVRFWPIGEEKHSNFIESSLHITRDENPILRRLVVGVDGESCRDQVYQE